MASWPHRAHVHRIPAPCAATRFQPDVLGITASSAFLCSCVEVSLIKLGYYLLSFGHHIPLLDILSLVGYKYIG